jgi:hypothetical protein
MVLTGGRKMKSYYLAFAALLLTSPAAAITPQKYCESLDAVSCEILNYEMKRGDTFFYGSNSGQHLPMLQVKYCRNRSFRFAAYNIDQEYGYYSPVIGQPYLYMSYLPREAGTRFRLVFNTVTEYGNPQKISQDISLNGNLCGLALNNGTQFLP